MLRLEFPSGGAAGGSPAHRRLSTSGSLPNKENEHEDKER